MSKVERSWNPMTVPLTWVKLPPPVDTAAVESRVRLNLDTELTSLRHPRNLAFHTVFLGATYDSETVTVFPMDSGEGFELIYDPDTKIRAMSAGNQKDYLGDPS